MATEYDKTIETIGSLDNMIKSNLLSQTCLKTLTHAKRICEEKAEKILKEANS